MTFETTKTHLIEAFGCDFTGKDIHHIDTNRNNNSIDNLIPLSPALHCFVHAILKWENEQRKQGMVGKGLLSRTNIIRFKNLFESDREICVEMSYGYYGGKVPKAMTWTKKQINTYYKERKARNGNQIRQHKKNSSS